MASLNYLKQSGHLNNSGEDSLRLDKQESLTNDSFADPFTDPFMDPFKEDIFACQETDRAERWSVSWADLMMTMFIFFVVLYVYQVKNQELTLGVGPGGNYISDEGPHRVVGVKTMTQPSGIYKRARQLFKDEFVDDTATVDLIADKAVRISLAGDIFFDVGRAELKAKARWRLRQIASFLHDNTFVVNVVGHTDDMPSHSRQYPTNWELSTARACAVTRYLIEDQGVEESRFFVSGHSWQQPLLPNNSLHNRSMNRRVEIILMKEVPYARVLDNKSE